MPSVQIYGVPLSAPTRIVMMTCEILGLDYEIKPCNVMKGDNRQPEYLKVNHSIFIWESGDIFMRWNNYYPNKRRNISSEY